MTVIHQDHEYGMPCTEGCFTRPTVENMPAAPVAELTPAAPPKAKHFSTGKSGVDQIPPELLMAWGDIFTHGAEKYGRDNWKGGTEWHEFYGSALRHLYKWWLGETLDPDSGEPHLGHALWNVGALLYFQMHALGTDDRPAKYEVRRIEEIAQ
jgi:hypothetical protein